MRRNVEEKKKRFVFPSPFGDMQLPSQTAGDPLQFLGDDALRLNNGMKAPEIVSGTAATVSQAMTEPRSLHKDDKVYEDIDRGMLRHP